jgi:hypothetical protein
MIERSAEIKHVTFIQEVAEGYLEVNWMWLPTFIGQNNNLLRELDKALEKKFTPPLILTDELLLSIHKYVIEWVDGKIGIKGLSEYLKAVEEVSTV